MEINYKDIINNKNILSPNNYMKINISSYKKVPLYEFVDRIDKGVEVGSNNYVNCSEFKFIRTAALTSSKYSIVEDENSILNISPKVFVKYNLKKNDILICKDSNVGEVVRLDRDLPNYMFSSGINRVVINKYADYIFAIMKNNKFKEQLISMIPKGATLMHAKDLYLECKIPFPESEKVLSYVSSLVKIISNKEEKISSKVAKLNDYIEKEILNNQKKSYYSYNYPTINDLLNINRLDTGNYTKEFCEIDHLLKNYNGEVFFLNKKNVTGGQTPKRRVISEDSKLKYFWITPTFINDDGTMSLNYRINCDKNNVTGNCSLIVNRTSKGGVGEYVGISAYYDFDVLGCAQHNQGLYKISGLSTDDLVYITCLLNSPLYRKYCANLSMGSKMKELKLNNILSIPFPKFSNQKKKSIITQYYNKLKKDDHVEPNMFEKLNDNWDNEAGVVDLYESVNNAKIVLNSIIDSIYNNRFIELEYKIF